MTEKVLSGHRIIWQSKPVLREIYNDFYRRIVEACLPGRSLEIGGGPGNLKGFIREVVSTDIVPMPWLDAAADAQALPFAADSFANIVAVDVLHHIERPALFLAEVERVLQPGGRLILVEPAITPVSRIFYTLFHPEPVDMYADPLENGPIDPGRQPFNANQAIPTLLFCRRSRQMKQAFPRLNLLRVEKMSLFAYPLSGGFRPWSLVPAAFVRWLLKLERILAPVIGGVMAFRLFVVIEKQR